MSREAIIPPDLYVETVLLKAIVPEIEIIEQRVGKPLSVSVHLMKDGREIRAFPWAASTLDEGSEPADADIYMYFSAVFHKDRFLFSAAVVLRDPLQPAGIEGFSISGDVKPRDGLLAVGRIKTVNRVTSRGRRQQSLTGAFEALEVVSKLAVDTATIVLFDPALLRHRLSNRPDWWSLPRNALDEMNQGRVVFLNVAADGTYEVHLTSDATAGFDGDVVDARLSCVSGRLFLGAGEDTTGGRFEPTEEFGTFVSVPPGTYEVRSGFIGPVAVRLVLSRVIGPAVNHFEAMPRLRE